MLTAKIKGFQINLIQLRIKLEKSIPLFQRRFKSVPLAKLKLGKIREITLYTDPVHYMTYDEENAKALALQGKDLCTLIDNDCAKVKRLAKKLEENTK